MAHADPSLSARTLRDELALVEDHARAQGYEQAADWIAKSLRPRRRRQAVHMAPEPKVRNLDREPTVHDVFRNLRTGWEACVMEPPEAGYVEVLNGMRRSRVQVNRLLNARLYKYEGNVGG